MLFTFKSIPQSRRSFWIIPLTTGSTFRCGRNCWKRSSKLQPVMLAWLVIKAAGENFSLGGDARDWPGVSVAELRPKIEVFAKAVDRLQELEIPTIASVQGGCMGG